MTPPPPATKGALVIARGNAPHAVVYRVEGLSESPAGQRVSLRYSTSFEVRGVRLDLFLERFRAALPDEAEGAAARCARFDEARQDLEQPRHATRHPFRRGARRSQGARR